MLMQRLFANLVVVYTCFLSGFKYDRSSFYFDIKLYKCDMMPPSKNKVCEVGSIELFTTVSSVRLTFINSWSTRFEKCRQVYRLIRLQHLLPF